MPITHNAARISVDATLFRSTEGKRTAQSFPPSSIQVGIMFSAAAMATFRPTASLPITGSIRSMRAEHRTIRLTGDVLNQGMRGDHPGVLRVAAYELRHKIINPRLCSRRRKLTWTASGSMSQALRHARTASMIHRVLHSTCSEHLRTTVFPVNRAATIGEMALCIG